MRIASFIVRRLLFAAVIASAIQSVNSTLAAESTDDVLKKVRGNYEKVDVLSFSCFLLMNEANGLGPTICLGSIEYRVDRNSGRFVIGTGGDVMLLVEDDQFFIYLWSDENGRPVYLRVTKKGKVEWEDIQAASQSIMAECRGTMPTVSLPQFIWPFLPGGIERLIPPSALVLDVESKNSEIFTVGHPDAHIRIGPKTESEKLDPRKFPSVVRSEERGAVWDYAFDRETGMLTAAIGVVDRERILGDPGNKVFVLLKVKGVFGKEPFDNETKEPPLELPQNAVFVETRQLKAAYRNVVDVEEVIEAQADLRKELDAARQRREQILARLTKSDPTADGAAADRESDRGELDDLRGKIVEYEHRLAVLKTLIDEYGVQQSPATADDQVKTRFFRRMSARRMHRIERGARWTRRR